MRLTDRFDRSFLCRKGHIDRLRGGILGSVRVLDMSRLTHTPALFLFFKNGEFWSFLRCNHQ